MEKVREILIRELDERQCSAEVLCKSIGLSPADARTIRRVVNQERENSGWQTITRILRALGYDVVVRR